jgi:hypothetical protein
VRLQAQGLDLQTESELRSQGADSKKGKLFQWTRGRRHKGAGVREEAKEGGTRGWRL